MEQISLMKISNASKYILGIFAAAGILAGCSSGSQSTLTPSAGMNAIHTLGAPSYKGVLIAAFRPGVPLARAYKNALVTPDKKKHRKKLGYISNFYNSDILEFHYPKGASLSKSIDGDDPQGLCEKSTKGDFWIVDSGSDTVEEYKANTTTDIKSLSVTAGEPAGCAWNSSDLAVSILGEGDVVIFKGATGSGTEISDGLESTYFVGYDPSGDLFADGISESGTVGLSELDSGSSSFHNVSLPNDLEFPGAVNWDGKYITVEDQEGEAIYGYTVSGSSATLERTVNYSDASDCVDGFIYKGSAFLCPDAGDENAKVYAYPAGGAPEDTWTGDFDLPIGALVIEQ